MYLNDYVSSLNLIRWDMYTVYGSHVGTDWLISLYRHLGYERVYLPLPEVADTPFYIQGDDMPCKPKRKYMPLYLLICKVSR